MKNYVVVYFEKPWMNVDGKLLTTFNQNDVSPTIIENTLPHRVEVDKINTIAWVTDRSDQTGFRLKGGSVYTFDNTEENYNKWVKPFVDLWQAEKDRIEQEEQQAQEEYNKFENCQARALTQLNADFETVKDNAHLKSSLGFAIDANPTAKENVQGLIEEVGDGTVQFCDYYNQFHELNKSQLETLKSEINQNGQALYAQKWQYRTAIEQCSDNEGLDQVVASIEFTYMDFTQ